MEHSNPVVAAQAGALTPPLLSVEGVSWQVPGREILSDLSLCIQPGEFVGVIGPNGAGKSSLLRMIYRRLRPDSGTIRLSGQSLDDMTTREIARRVAVVHQETETEFAILVRDVIALGLIPHQPLLGLSRREDRERIERAAAMVDVGALLDRPMDELSGGEKQRVMIARAIVQSPRLLLMDEPTNHLDVSHQMEVLDLARKLGVTALVSIHDLNLAAAYCDRLLVLARGKLIAEGSPEDVLTEPLLKQVFDVNARVDRHPVLGHPRITYLYPIGEH